MSEVISDLSSINPQFNQDLTNFKLGLYSSLIAFSDPSHNEIRIDPESYNTYDEQFSSENRIPFLEILTKLFQNIEKLLTEEILPTLFDIVIEVLFYIAEKTTKEPYFTLQNIFEFFRIFGLKSIPLKTINTIIKALQQRSWFQTWVSTEFCISYYESLSESTSTEIKEAILTLIQLSVKMERDMVNKEKNHYQGWEIGENETKALLSVLNEPSTKLEFKYLKRKDALSQSIKGKIQLKIDK